MTDRRSFVVGMAALAITPPKLPTRAERLAAAARKQLGVTTGYDPRYVRMSYPNGDVPRSTGVCADVIVRAYRDALGLDLQRLLHEDMERDFTAYPRMWNMAHPDTNIDQRRVPNLEIFWCRAKSELWIADRSIAGDAFPRPIAMGDLLTWRLDARLPHVAVVVTADGHDPTVVHNIGGGVEEVQLMAFREHRAHGHYRWEL